MTYRLYLLYVIFVFLPCTLLIKEFIKKLLLSRFFFLHIIHFEKVNSRFSFFFKVVVYVAKVTCTLTVVSAAMADVYGRLDSV